MGHLAAKFEIWDDLRLRLDRHPAGLPRHAAVERILALLFTEDEARLAAAFPAATVLPEELAAITGRPEAELRPLLDSMAAKGLVMEIEGEDRRRYWLSAAFPGFFEYTFMRFHEGVPYGELARLMEAYFRESDFAMEIGGLETPRVRSLVRGEAVGEGLVSEILPYETARGLIERAAYGSLQTCFCRHKNVHLGKTCSRGAPVEDICMSFGLTADFLIKRGFARRAEKEELLRRLDQTEDLGLVHIADNFRDDVIFICHCCGCCCELIRMRVERRCRRGIAPTRFVPVVQEDRCQGCGTCRERCPIGAVEISREGIARVDGEWCFGCGGCVRHCPSKALSLAWRAEAATPPRNLRAMTLRILKEKERSRAESSAAGRSF